MKAATWLFVVCVLFALSAVIGAMFSNAVCAVVAPTTLLILTSVITPILMDRGVIRN